MTESKTTKISAGNKMAIALEQLLNNLGLASLVKNKIGKKLREQAKEALAEWMNT